MPMQHLSNVSPKPHMVFGSILGLNMIDDAGLHCHIDLVWLFCSSVSFLFFNLVLGEFRLRDKRFDV